MTDDLVKRLNMASVTTHPMTLVIVIREAAACIEELERSRQHWQDCYTRKVQHEIEVRARIEKLEAALIAITITAPFGKPQEIARAALGEKKDG
jgi:lipase chaperone LimK